MTDMTDIARQDAHSELTAQDYRQRLPVEALCVRRKRGSACMAGHVLVGGSVSPGMREGVGLEEGVLAAVARHLQLGPRAEAAPGGLGLACVDASIQQQQRLLRSKPTAGALKVNANGRL